MAEILSKKKSTYGGPYAFYTVDVSTSARTPTSVKLKVKVTANLQYAASLLGTGNGFGLVAGIYVGDEWHEWTLKKESTSWKGTKKHTAETSFTVKGLNVSTTTLSGIKFRCLRTEGAGNSARLNKVSCSNIKISNVVDKYTNVGLTLDEVSQVAAKVTISGLPSAVGYARTIKWYDDNIEIASTSISKTSEATSFVQKFADLEPNTNYYITAKVYSGNSVLSTNALTISTPPETGELVLLPGDTYINATVHDMYDTPNYERKIEFYIKRSTDKDYALAYTAIGQGTSVNAVIRQRKSNVKYDVKARILNGSIILREMVGSVKTTENSSLVPKAIILSVKQQKHTRKCTLMWNVDKAVYNTEFTFEIRYRIDAGRWSEWQTYGYPVYGVQPSTTVVAPVGNTDIAVRIKTTNPIAEGVANYSDEVYLYVKDDFEWDTDKIAGQPVIITANEWNRLREYVLDKNEELGYTITIPIVRTGDEITAKIYNIMKNALLLASYKDPVMMLGVGKLGEAKLLSLADIIADKRSGDVIIAEDIDWLRTQVNAEAT